jgi:hypothetical protein
VVPASLGKKEDLNSKIIKAKRAGGMAQAVENLSSKCKALSSNPSTTREKSEKICSQWESPGKWGFKEKMNS